MFSMTTDKTITAVHVGKGGMAKSTTASSFSYILGEKRNSCLLVDMNVEQPTCTEIYEQLKVKATYDLTTEDHPQKISKIPRVPHRDVIMDTPPSKVQAKVALDVADFVIVPFHPEWAEVRGFMRTIKHLKSEGKLFRVLFTRIHYTERGTSKIMREGFAAQDIPMFETEIRHYKAHSNSQSLGYPVFSEESRGTVRRSEDAEVDYRDAVSEYLEFPEINS